MNNAITFTIQLELEDVLYQNSSHPVRERANISSKVLHVTALKHVIFLHLPIAHTVINILKDLG
jgi:hypothetical protein